MDFIVQDENISSYSKREKFCLYRTFFLGLLHNNYQLLLDNNIMNVKDMYYFIVNKVLPESYLPKYKWYGINMIELKDDADIKWIKYLDFLSEICKKRQGTPGNIISIFAFYMNIHIIVLNENMIECTKYTFVNDYIVNPKCTFMIKIDDEEKHIEFINTNNNTELLNDNNYIQLYKNYNEELIEGDEFYDFVPYDLVNNEMVDDEYLEYFFN